jgi:4-hydroxy-tetrahydrodipicolinate synthase
MFRGNLVALITPFRNDEVDEPALRNLVEFQISQGTHGIVACGTTGEAATMSEAEWRHAVGVIIDQNAGRLPVIAGTGTNATRSTIARTQAAQELGADGALVVTPYYNKPTQEGLYRHFAAVAEAADLPMVLYNVPGRASVNMLSETVERLAAIRNIIGIKEASALPDQTSQIIIETGLNVLSGDDSLTLPIMSVGGVGVISVLANVAPSAVSQLCEAMFAGDVLTARRIHWEIFSLCRMMFIETNPIPAKTAAGWLGLCSDEVRMPLCEMIPANRERLIAALQASPWIEPARVYVAQNAGPVLAGAAA